MTQVLVQLGVLVGWEVYAWITRASLRQVEVRILLWGAACRHKIFGFWEKHWRLLKINVFFKILKEGVGSRYHDLCKTDILKFVFLIGIDHLILRERTCHGVPIFIW